MRGRKAKVQLADRLTVGYARVSRTEQVESGHSLDAQERRLGAYAEGTGRVLSEVYTDAGVSAGTMKRPELQRLLAGVRSGQIASVCVTKLDRLSRSLSDLLEIVKLFAKHLNRR